MAEAFLLGVGGVKSADLQTKSVNLNLANGDQVISPDTGYDGMTSVTVICPATAIRENIKKDVNLGGIIGTYEGEAIPNALDGLVDGTITTFTMPQGKTTVKKYLFDGNTSLRTANLQGATTIGDYAFNGCTNAEIALPSTLTSIGTYAFQNASRVSSVSAMELSCPNNFCRLKSYAFSGAKIAKVSGKFITIGNNAFSSAMNLTEIDIEVGSEGILDSAFSGNVYLTKLHLKLNGAGLFTNCFNGCSNVSDFSIQGTTGTIGVNAFNSLGINRSNQANNRFIFDFSSSTFTSINNSAFYEIDYSDFFIPVSCSSIMSSSFQNGRNNNIYFLSSTPATIQSSSFSGIYQTTLWVPYNSANAYRTATNWTTVASSIQGWAPANTFTTGDTLPEINDEGYGLTWYSDEARTQQVTTVADATQKLYCVVGTTVVAYKFVNEKLWKCTTVVTDGVTNYTLGDFIPSGTVLTINGTPTVEGYVPYIFQVNGTTFTPGDTFTMNSELSILAFYWDGVTPPVDPVLENNTWEDIRFASQNGLTTLWNLGDEKTDSNGYKWVLVDKKEGRYSLVGGGSTNLVFMMKDTTNVSNGWSNSASNVTYSASSLRSSMLSGGSVYAAMDQTLASIVNTNKITVLSTNNNDSGTNSSQVSFFAPCCVEMTGSGYGQSTNAETENNGVRYGRFEYFTTATLRKKYRTGTTTYTPYPTRSKANNSYGIIISNSGSADYPTASGTKYVCPCVAL